MINRNYDKLCDAGRLDNEIVAAGFIKYPTTGFKYYGTQCYKTDTGFETIVMLYDAITQQETGIIDTVVANHVPIPLPEPEAPKSEDGKLYVRAEVRPLDCTTYFTNTGDIAGAIGEGSKLYWNFTSSDNLITAPDGYKRKRMDVSFIDFVYLKAGTITVKDVTEGSYLDFYLVAPAGSYIMMGGQPFQLPMDVPVAHFVNKLIFIRDGLYCIDPQTISGQIPPGYIFRVEVTVPTADTSIGTCMMILYRQRTIA